MPERMVHLDHNERGHTADDAEKSQEAVLAEYQVLYQVLHQVLEV
jgi:hypothetical protein